MLTNKQTGPMVQCPCCKLIQELPQWFWCKKCGQDLTRWEQLVVPENVVQPRDLL